jgi:hypothetical protein
VVALVAQATARGREILSILILRNVAERAGKLSREPVEATPQRSDVLNGIAHQLAISQERFGHFLTPGREPGLIVMTCVIIEGFLDGAAVVVAEIMLALPLEQGLINLHADFTRQLFGSLVFPQTGAAKGQLVPINK